MNNSEAFEVAKERCQALLRVGFNMVPVEMGSDGHPTYPNGMLPVCELALSGQRAVLWCRQTYYKDMSPANLEVNWSQFYVEEDPTKDIGVAYPDDWWEHDRDTWRFENASPEPFGEPDWREVPKWPR